MNKVCAWCSKPMNVQRRDGTLVSHGICPACARQVLGADARLRDLPGAEPGLGPVAGLGPAQRSVGPSRP
jgi:hypothetical protein